MYLKYTTSASIRLGVFFTREIAHYQYLVSTVIDACFEWHILKLLHIVKPPYLYSDILHTDRLIPTNTYVETGWLQNPLTQLARMKVDMMYIQLACSYMSPMSQMYLLSLIF